MEEEDIDKPEREKSCGILHYSILEAIRHAEERLQCRHLPMRAYWGRLPTTEHYIVGFEASPRKRWRLDYDPEKKMHINEENYDAGYYEQKTVHFISGGEAMAYTRVLLQWRKWTSGAAEIPEKVQERIAFRRGRR